MTCSLRPLEKEHLMALLEQPINAGLREWYSDSGVSHLLRQEFSASLFYKDRLMVSGGVIPYWANRAQIWTLFSEESKHNFLPVFRGIKRFLLYQPFKRVEACVPNGLDIGKRRLLKLGFNLECGEARAFLPTGENAALFSYVRDI